MSEGKTLGFLYANTKYQIRNSLMEWLFTGSGIHESFGKDDDVRVALVGHYIISRLNICKYYGDLYVAFPPHFHPQLKHWIPATVCEGPKSISLKTIEPMDIKQEETALIIKEILVSKMLED